LRLSRRAALKSFDDGLGLRRRGGLGFSQAGSFFSLTQQEFQLPGIKLLAFDSEDPTDQQIDFFFEQRVFRASAAHFAPLAVGFRRRL